MNTAFVICLNDYPQAVVIGSMVDAEAKKKVLRDEDLQKRTDRPAMYFWHIREVPLFKEVSHEDNSRCRNGIAADSNLPTGKAVSD